jgi:DNA-binding transcriptional regulator YdaS (Cro superfamily)
MVQQIASAPAAADLRAEMARRQVEIYRLSARIGLHPSHLGQVLRGRRPLPPDLAERIERAIREEGMPDAAA